MTLTGLCLKLARARFTRLLSRVLHDRMSPHNPHHLADTNARSQIRGSRKINLHRTGKCTCKRMRMILIVTLITPGRSNFIHIRCPLDEGEEDFSQS